MLCGLSSRTSDFISIIKPSAVDAAKARIDLLSDVTLNLNLMQVKGKKMIQKGEGGAIVNTSSVAGYSAFKTYKPYSVVDGILEQF